MADRDSTFQIAFDGDASTFRSVLTALKSQIKSDVNEIESTTSAVELFKGANAKLDAFRATALKARDAVVEIQQSIDRVNAGGGKVGDDLAKQFAAAEKASTSASKAYSRQADTVQAMSARLQKAGVDTKNLAAEELRLAAALDTAQKAAALTSAKDLLGFKGVQDVAPEIAKLQSAFATLQASGKLSATEIATAQGLLRQRVDEVNASVSTLGGTFKNFATEANTSLAGFASRVLAPVVAFEALAKGIESVSEASRAFEQGAAAIGSVTSLTQHQIEDLTNGVRTLALTVGFDLNQGLKGLFDILRANVPTDNALAVLEVAGKAANASITDLEAGVKTATLLINAAGVPVNGLARAFGTLIEGAKDGGVTLDEFAASAGPLLNIARSVNVPFNELVATLTVMVRSGSDAGTAIGDLGRILTKLNTADAQKKLLQLGIATTDFVDTLQQLGAKKLGLDQFLELGIASTKSAAGVATLTNNITQLRGEIERETEPLKAFAEALQKFYDSPKGRSQAFNAELEAAKTGFGELVGSGSRLGQVGTLILHQFNEIPAAFREAAHAAQDPKTSLLGIAAAFLQVDPLASESARLLRDTGFASEEAAKKFQTFQDKAKVALGAFASDISAQAGALDTLLQRNIADLNAEAEAQIAALDKSKEAAADTAAKTLQIRLKLGNDTLAVIEKYETNVTATTNAAIAAREAAARANGATEQQIAIDTAQFRIASLTPVLEAYRNHINKMIAIEQGELAQYRQAEDARVAINRSTEDAIRQAQFATLSGLDQFVARNAEIDRLISEGRKAAAQNDTATAKQYFDAAINEAKGFGTVVDQNGITVITNLQAATAKTDGLKRITDAANTAFGAMAQASKDGAGKAAEEAENTRKKMVGVKDAIDDAKAAAEKAILLTVKTDQQSIADAENALDALTRARIVDVTVRLKGSTSFNDPNFHPSNETYNPSPDGGPGFFSAPLSDFGLARGGPVGFKPGTALRPITSDIGPIVPVAQRYAHGGAVFRGPKVPGIGNQDTFPALLNTGSFVVRKSASKRYGDAIMSTLTRFAAGGAVTTPAPGFSFGPAAYGAFPDYAGPFADSIGTPTLPTDFKDQVNAVFAYIAAVKSQISLDKPHTYDLTLKQLDGAIEFFNHAPNPTNLMHVLDLARDIGLNLGYTVGGHAGFDVDGRRWHAVQSKAFGSLPHSIGGGSYFDYEFYAKGGPASDTVKAMLTPGEFVFSKPAVDNVSRKFGSGFLPALNEQRIPKLDLEAMFAAPARPRYFADGGYVGDVSHGNARAQAGGGSRDVHVTVTAAAGDLLSRENVRRFIVPVLEDMQRKSSLGVNRR